MARESKRALGRKMETEEEASEIRGLSPHRTERAERGEEGHYTLSFHSGTVRPGGSSIMGHQTLNSSFEGERDRPFKRRLKEKCSVGDGASFRADGAVRNRRRRGSRSRRPPMRLRRLLRRYHLNPPTAITAI